PSGNCLMKRRRRETRNFTLLRLKLLTCFISGENFLHTLWRCFVVKKTRQFKVFLYSGGHYGNQKGQKTSCQENGKKSRKTSKKSNREEGSRQKSRCKKEGCRQEDASQEASKERIQDRL